MEGICGVAGPPRTWGHSSISNCNPILCLCHQATASVTVAIRRLGKALFTLSPNELNFSTFKATIQKPFAFLDQVPFWQLYRCSIFTC